MHLHPFDWSLARKAGASIVVSACAATAVVVATDEPANTIAMRLSRLAALAPLLTCIGVFAASAHARLRGETAALEARGVSPWAANRGAALAGWVAGVLALVVVASPWADAASLFPRFVPAVDWIMDSSRSVAQSGSARVLSDGTIQMSTSAVELRQKGPGVASALACLAPLVLSVPAWVVTNMTHLARAVSVLSAASILLVALHFIAAGRTGAWIGVLPAMPLVAAALSARGRRARSDRSVLR